MINLLREPDFTLREGTNTPVIRATLRDDDGHVPSFAAGGTVKLHLARGVNQAPDLILDAHVIPGREDLPDDTELPNVEYEWSLDDTTIGEARGVYEGYWFVTWPDGSTGAYPSRDRFLVEITPY